MKKLYLWVLTVAVTGFIALANASAASACLWVHYQPELPDSLRRY